MDCRRLLTFAIALSLVAGPAAAAPQGKVVIAQGVDPTTLDTMNQQETPASVVAAHLFDTLVERDPNLKAVPALAAEIPRLVSPQVWEVKLRRGVKFHNGEEFDAESVKFSLERVKLPTMRASSNFRPIDRVEIVDPYTVRVHTSKPWPTFTTVMGFRQASMYPPKAYAGKDSAFISKNPIGTGPYKLVRWSKDEEIVLEANEQYWRGAPRIKTVVFRPIPDDAVRVAALQNGEVDVAVNIPPHLANIIAGHPRVFLTTAPSIRTLQLMFVTHEFDAQHKLVGPYKGVTADKRVRQAITSAIDADEIIKSVLDGKAIRLATMLTPLHFGYDAALKPVKQDVAKAKKLLAEAGYAGGLELTLNSPQGPLRARQGGGGGGEWPAHQGRHQDDAQDPRVRELPEQHGLRAQGGAGVADRVGHADHRCRDRVRSALPDRQQPGELQQPRFRRHGRPGAEHDGRKAAARALPQDQQALDRRCGGRSALSADRSLRGEQAAQLEGPERRGDQGLRHVDQVAMAGWAGG
jgi:ABC-type transport system substrate-binding protein